MLHPQKADVKARIDKAWGALDGLNDIWKSVQSDDIKRDFFHAAVQPVLIYGSQSWTLTKKLEAKLDGTCTSMLRAVLNISWKKHPTKQRLYGKLPPISKIIRESHIRFAGHSWRSKQELVSNPYSGPLNMDIPSLVTYIDQLYDDTGCLPEDLPNAMSNRDSWRDRVIDICASMT